MPSKDKYKKPHKNTYNKKEYKNASVYKVDKDEQKIKLPMLIGIPILLIALKYLIIAFVALGKGESFYFLSSGVIFALFIVSFMLLRHGESLEIIYNKSKYAKHSKYPYKTMGAIALSVATTYSAYLGSYSWFSSLMLGVSVLVGWYMYYGFDPRVDKIDGYDNDKSAQRIMTLLVKANDDIEDIKGYSKSMNSTSTARLTKEMAEEFEKIVQHIENEPDDYDKARKYLVSYLGELKDMSETFAKLDAKDKTNSIVLAFEDTLKQSIKKLKAQYDKLLDDDILDLDIKLSVMKKRLKEEA